MALAGAEKGLSRLRICELLLPLKPWRREKGDEEDPDRRADKRDLVCKRQPAAFRLGGS